MKLIACFAVALILLLSGCAGKSGADNAVVPRPRAYPRVAEIGGEYRDTIVGGVTIPVNVNAVISSSRHDWLNVDYPGYRATIYITVTAPQESDALDVAIANRLERISLNVGGRRARTEELANAFGFHAVVTIVEEPSPLPFQFLAVSPDHRLLSGAVSLSGAIEPADSVAPVLRRLRDDVTNMIQNLELQ